MSTLLIIFAFWATSSLIASTLLVCICIRRYIDNGDKTTTPNTANEEGRNA